MGYTFGGPYDRILVGATAPSISFKLLDQLNEGGRMIIPTAATLEDALTFSERPPDVLDMLWIVDRVAGGFIPLQISPCKFVPLSYEP